MCATLLSEVPSCLAESSSSTLSYLYLRLTLQSHHGIIRCLPYFSSQLIVVMRPLLLKSIRRRMLRDGVIEVLLAVVVIDDAARGIPAGSWLVCVSMEQR